MWLSQIFGLSKLNFGYSLGQRAVIMVHTARINHRFCTFDCSLCQVALTKKSQVKYHKSAYMTMYWYSRKMMTKNEKRQYQKRRRKSSTSQKNCHIALAVVVGGAAGV